MKFKISNKILIILLLVTAIIIIGFIWTNSLLSGAESHEKSDSIIDLIKPIIDPNDNISQKTFSFSIRKFAHFIEFMLLGSILMLIKMIYHKPQLITLLFISMSVGLIDELIQSFSDRTDSVKDVLLDFSGALTGIVIVYFIHWIIIKNKRKNGKNVSTK